MKLEFKCTYFRTKIGLYHQYPKPPPPPQPIQITGTKLIPFSIKSVLYAIQTNMMMNNQSFVTAFYVVCCLQRTTVTVVNFGTSVSHPEIQAKLIQFWPDFLDPGDRCPQSMSPIANIEIGIAIPIFIKNCDCDPDRHLKNDWRSRSRSQLCDRRSF